MLFRMKSSGGTLDGTTDFHTKIEERGNENSHEYSFPLVCIFCKISCKKFHVNNPIFFDKKLRGNYTKSDKNFCRKMTKKGEKNNVKNSIFHDKKIQKNTFIDTCVIAKK